MRRLIALLLALLAAAPARAEPARLFHPSPAFNQSGPALARGVLVWLHGSYDSAQFPASPPEQAWVGRMAALGYDIWRFDREPGHDPLAAGGADLLQGLKMLRHDGYRRVVVAGHSRGAFIGLSALAHPELADAVAAISPAAHGTNPARRPAALRAFSDLMRAIPHEKRHPARFAFVTLRDDPLEPDAKKRVSLVRQAARRTGLTLLVIDRPADPVGHMGGYEPGFDAHFGACLAAFLDGAGTRCKGG